MIRLRGVAILLLVLMSLMSSAFEGTLGHILTYYQESKSQEQLLGWLLIQLELLR